MTPKNSGPIFVDSNNIFSYAAKIKENINEWFDADGLERNYNMLRIVQHNYDKILWVSTEMLQQITFLSFHHRKEYIMFNTEVILTICPLF